MALTMKTNELQTKVTEEIMLIPNDRLSELYDFIHFFRLGLETAKSGPKNTMRFAGSWKDMTDMEFKEFSEEIAGRRRYAFSGRKGREALTD